MHALVPVAAGNTGCRVKVFAPYGGEAAVLQAGLEASGGIRARGALETGRVKPVCVTADPAEAAAGVDMVLLVLPAFAHGPVLARLAPHLPEGIAVGAVPARSGFEFQACRTLAAAGQGRYTVFGLQTLPWACRVREYGAEVEVLGVKKGVGAAAVPRDETWDLCGILSRLTGVEVYPWDNMLELSLANVGQVIHPGIMYGLFKDYDGTPFKEEGIPLFYAGVSEETAAVLENLSREIQLAARRLEEYLGPEVSLARVPALKDWLLASYSDQIEDASTLARAFTTNRAYRGLKVPVQKVAPGLYKPDFQSRYLTEDVPAGLVVTCALARLARVATPTVERVIEVTSAWMGKEYLKGGSLAGKDIAEARVPQNYGLHDPAALKEFILQGPAGAARVG